MLVTFSGGGTATRLALDMVRNLIIPSSKRPDSKKALFLITDGESNVGGSPKKAANYLKNKEKVEIYVIGIGKKVRDESLRGLASKAENVFPLKSFKDLKKLKRKIAILPKQGTNEYIASEGEYTTLLLLKRNVLKRTKRHTRQNKFSRIHSQKVNKLQQTCQFHQLATSLLKSGLLQLVICRLVTTC